MVSPAGGTSTIYIKIQTGKQRSARDVVGVGSGSHARAESLEDFVGTIHSTYHHVSVRATSTKMVVRLTLS